MTVENGSEESTQSAPNRADAKVAARRPRAVLWAALAIILAWMAVGAMGGQTQGRLSEVQKNDNASFLPTSAESTNVIDMVGRFSQSEELPFLLSVEKDQGSLTPADLATLGQFATSLRGLKLTAIGGGSLGDYLVGSAPIVPVPSQDGKAALFVIPLDGTKGTETINKSSALLAGAEAIRAEGDRVLKPAGLTAHLGGPAGLISDFGAAFAGIDGILLRTTLAVVLIILLVVYRSPVLPIIVLLSAVFGLFLAEIAVYPLAKNGTIALSGQSQGIMSILVIGAATDYALLLVSRYREELHDHASAWEAMKRAWRGSIEPIAASAATVILGLLCLLLANLGSTSGLGPVGAFGIAGAFLASLTFLPATLVLLGRKAFWPFAPKVDHVHREDKVGTRGVWGRVAGVVGNYPRRTWVVTLVGLLALAAFAPSLKADGVSVADTFLTKVDSVEAQDAIERHFPAGSGSPVQIVVPQDKAEAALALVTKDDGIQSAFLGLVPPAPGSPAVPPAVVDGQVLIQATSKDAADSPGGEEVVTRLRSDLDSVSSEAIVGGNAAINLDVREAGVRDLKLIVPVVLLVIFAVLCLLLRAVIAPLLLVAANVLSFGAAIGLSALVFNHVFEFAGGDPSIPLYGFVFLVALGIDYSIFLTTRVREEATKRTTREGILTGLAVTGGVITSAGIVLAATFSALVVLPLIFLVQIAFIVAAGVLLDTFIVRSLLVPALSYDIGSRIWWPSALARRP